jgi:hypothetical protein
MISIGLNLILGMLLTCALILGVRLEKRLRGLRQGHADFAKAVGELDQAAGRTETSLAALRAGTEAAKSELASRIDQARIACQRLEKLSAEAERIADRPLPLAHPVTAPAALATAPSAFARPEPEALRPAAPIQTRPAPAPATPRSRARLIDDDLFSMEPPPPARKAGIEAFETAPPPRSAIVEPRKGEGRAAEPKVMQIKADNDPIVGMPANASRSAREAFYREMLERETFAPDPFEDGDFARERRVMLAAVMGGRR